MCPRLTTAATEGGARIAVTTAATFLSHRESGALRCQLFPTSYLNLSLKAPLGHLSHPG